MHPDRLFLMGVKYDLGKGVTQDFNKAREYYEQAASGGHIKALNNLGTLYENGEGVVQDYSKAKEYYERASNLGNALASFNLGELYFNGLGVIQDYEKAAYYYKISADKGHSKSKSRLNEIANIDKLRTLFTEECKNPLVSRRIEIIKDIIERQIKYLFHFTHIDNLEGILKFGFIPRTILDSNNITYKHNDEWRYEGRTNCTCFSIEYPNEFMMKTYRNKWKLRELEVNKERNERLCLIRLNILPLLKNHTGDIYFTPYNAASGYIKYRLSNNPESFSTYESFKNMFTEKNPDTRPGRLSRSEQNLPLYVPTHHQAEVLISDVINSDYINAIFFPTEESYNYFLKNINLPASMNNISCIVDDSYFGPRNDIQWEVR